MATDTNVETLIINKMTQEQYNALTEKNPAQVYVVTDAQSGDGTDNNGLEGDYATTYGIVDETTSGLPYIKAVGSTTVVIPAGLVLDVPGQSGLTTVASAIEYEVETTDNPTLFLAQGTVIEATDVFFQTTEPENGTTGYAAWWNGTTWQFKSNDTGNVWRPANAVRIAKTVFTGTSLTRLCFTGCRVLNKQEYLSKSGGALTGPLVSADAGVAYSFVKVLALQATKQDGTLGPIVNIEVNTSSDSLSINGDLTVSKTFVASNIGSIYGKINTIYMTKINNGENIAVPTTGGTMALKEEVVGLVMPSDQSIDIDATNIADGFNYLAPANGYIAYAQELTAEGQWVNLDNITGVSSRVYGSTGGYDLKTFIPVRAGTTTFIQSTAGGALTYLKFVYAQGAI